MRVEHPAEHDVQEEALRLVLCLRQVAVLEVGGDHTRVMRPVPGPSGGVVGEGHPVIDGTRGGWTRKVPAQADGLAAVTDDSLIDGTPPRATGTLTERWLQHTPLDLPAHE
jgi:hypothetical protein